MQSGENVKGNLPARTGKKPVVRKTKRRRKGWIITSVVILAVAAAVFFLRNNQNVIINPVALADTSIMGYADLRNVISASGTVESAEKTLVYAKMSGTIDSVNVEVGHYVNEGDLLCSFDSATILRQIDEKELSMKTTQRQSSQSVKSAQTNYDNYVKGLEEGTNTSLINAKNSVTSARDSLEKAERAYNEHKKSLDDKSYAQITSQQNAFLNATLSHLNAERDYEEAVKAYNEASAKLNSYTPQSASSDKIAAAQAELLAAQGVVAAREGEVAAAQAAFQTAMDAYNGDKTAENLTALQAAEAVYKAADTTLLAAKQNVQTKSDALNTLLGISSTSSAQQTQLMADYTAKSAALTAKESALVTAENNLKTAKSNLDSAIESADKQLEDLARNIEAAQKALDNALESQRAAEAGVNQQLDSYKMSLDTAKANTASELADYQLEQLYRDLEKTAVKAPVSGTVTAVYASQNASAQGLLFVIEDTQNLIIECTVKGIDIAAVSVGMPVAIKSDATGSDIYEGSMTFIAPTSVKNTQGATSTAGETLFNAEVDVKTKNTGLKIGLAARLEYIVDEKKNVPAVPYNAVYMNSNGENCVLVIGKDDTGAEMIYEAIVQVGMESDFFVEILGGCEIGSRVVGYPDAYKDYIGKQITLTDMSVRSNPTSGFMFEMGR